MKDIAFDLALVYIQNGNKSISEMSPEEFTASFAEIYNRISSCLSADNENQVNEQMTAFLKATSGDNSFTVQT